MDKNAKIYVAGHRGLVGSAIVQSLHRQGFQNLLLKTSAELDLRRQAAVETFLAKENPEYIVIAAAKVGGIIANQSFSSEFLYDNLMIASNLIHAAAELKSLRKLLFLGSSCIYPKLAPQPLREEYLLTGSLETSNEAYALSKIAGLKLTEYYHRQHGKPFISVMPPNLYGPGDNFHLEHSHVIPALLRRFHEAKLSSAKSLAVWGTGTPLREFLYSEDLADGCVFMLENYSEAGFLNLGSGEEVSIRGLAELIAEITGFTGKIEFDSTRPDGTPRKVMDSNRSHAMGWKPKVSLKEGLVRTYQWFLKNEIRS